MGRWTPPNNRPVGSNEHIGRRLFDEPKLFGARDQNPFEGLDLRNFEATADREFSVDRVGDSCCNPKVMKYLTPRAHAAATKFRTPRKFHGWLTVPARKLQIPKPGMNWSVVPSPDPGPLVNGAAPPRSDDDMAQNRYHAHVPLPSGMESLFFAYLVRDVFTGGKPFLAPGVSIAPGPELAPTPLSKEGRLWLWGRVWFEKLRRFLFGQE